MQEYREALIELRAEAARTPPPEEAPSSGSKKKMPSKLAGKLDALTRPFYLSAESAVSTNRAKKILWGLLMPMLTTWSAEPTIKTKMQKINSHIIGQYSLAKERFEKIAQWHGARRSGFHAFRIAARQAVTSAFPVCLAFAIMGDAGLGCSPGAVL